MSSPYRPPEADLGPSPQPRWRVAHSMTAFASAVVLPLALVAFVRWIADAPFTRLEFLGGLTLGVTGGVIAAAAVFRHQRLPLWGAAVVGVAVVFLLVAMPMAWDAAMSAGRPR